MAVAVKVKTIQGLSRAFVGVCTVWIPLSVSVALSQEEEPTDAGTAVKARLAEISSDSEAKVEQPAKKDRIGLVIESTSSSAKVYTSIPGAKTTVLAAAHEWEYGLRLFTDVEWRARKYELEAFYKEAEKTADAIVDAMEPKFQRDSREVVEYALIESDDVFLSSAVTSTRFLPRFRRFMGDELRVVVVDRHIIYVFPAVGGKLEAYSPAIADIYRTTRFPGSLEIFQVNAKGYRVLGTIDS